MSCMCSVIRPRLETAVFGQNGPGRFLGRRVRHRVSGPGDRGSAPEIWFPCRRYPRSRPTNGDWSRRVVPADQLRPRRLGRRDPAAVAQLLKVLKQSFNADTGAVRLLGQMAYLTLSSSATPRAPARRHRSSTRSVAGLCAIPRQLTWRCSPPSNRFRHRDRAVLRGALRHRGSSGARVDSRAGRWSNVLAVAAAG